MKLMHLFIIGMCVICKFSQGVDFAKTRQFVSGGGPGQCGSSSLPNLFNSISSGFISGGASCVNPQPTQPAEVFPPAPTLPAATPGTGATTSITTGSP